MPVNQFEITSLALNGTVAAFEGESEFLATVDTKAAKGYTMQNINVGQTVEVVLPPRPNEWIEGRVINPESSVYDKVSVTVVQKNTSRVISDAELELSAKDFFEDIVTPDTNGGVRDAEISALQSILLQGSMADISSVGQDPTNSRIWSDINAKASMMLMPSKNRMGIMNPLAMSGLSNNESKLFGPAQILNAAALDGKVKMLAGVGKFYDSVNLPRQVNGSGNTTGVTVDGTQAPGSTLNMIGVGNALTYFPGQQFYFSDSGVGNAEDPEKHLVLPFKQTFTVTSAVTSDSSGHAAVSFTPPIITTGSLRNIPAMPASGAAITFLGEPNTAYPQAMLYHPSTFNFVGLNLPTFDNRGGVSKMKKFKNIPLRSVYFTDYKEGQNYLRYDRLTAIVTIHYQHAWRQWGKAETP